MKFTMRVWPRGLRAVKLSLAGPEWSVDGMTFNVNERLEVVHRLGSKGFAPFELSPEDAEKLMAVGSSGAKLGKMVLHCPGTLEHTIKKECWLEVNVTVYPKASARVPTFIGKGGDITCTEEEAPDMIRSLWAQGEEMLLNRETRDLGRKKFAEWAKEYTPCELTGVVHYDNPKLFDIDIAARQIMEGKAILLKGLAFSGKMARLIRDRLRYYTIEGRRPDEEGGLFHGYQLGGYVFRYFRRIDPSHREEEKRARIEKMHSATREKGAATRRSYFVRQVVNRIAKRFGVSEQRVMMRLIEHGIIDYLIRSVETVKARPGRQVEALLSGKITEAVRIVTYIIHGLEGRKQA